MSPTITKYLKTIKKQNKTKQNKEIIRISTKKYISIKEYEQGILKSKKITTPSPSGRYLGHPHSLLALDGN